MEPIINPWLIYFLGYIDNIHIFITVFEIMLGLAAGMMAMHATMEGYFSDPSDEERKFLRKIRRMVVTFFAVMFLWTFIPSRSTIIGMIVAQNITPDNVKTAVAAGKDIHDALRKDVMDIIEAIKKAPEEKKP